MALHEFATNRQLPTQGLDLLAHEAEIAPASRDGDLDFADPLSGQLQLEVQSLLLGSHVGGFAAQPIQFLLHCADPGTHPLQLILGVLGPARRRTDSQEHEHEPGTDENGRTRSGSARDESMVRRSHAPRTPALKSSLGGTSPTQTLSSSAAKSSPSIVPFLVPLRYTVVP
jgi:hypothetical protein